VGAGSATTGGYILGEGEVASTDDIAILTAAITDVWATAMAPRDNVTDILLPEIGDLTFTPGTWRSGTITIAAGATVTLDGQGDHNSLFLFQADTPHAYGCGRQDHPD
jgi:hypothetical protein